MPAWNASDTSQPGAAAARWPGRTSLSTAALMRLVQRDTVHGTLPRALLVVLAEHLHARGLPASPLIDADLWPLEQEPLGRLPVERFCRLLTRAALRLQDEHLGLQLGQSMQVHQLGALGYLLQASARLGDALLQVQQYHRLLHDLNPIEARVSGDRFMLCWGVAHGRPGPLFDEAGVAGIVSLGRRLCQQPPRLLSVDFVNPPPTDAGPHQAFFQCPVRWAQAETRIVLPLADLDQPLRQADARLQALMSHQLAPALATLGQAEDLSARIRPVVVHLARQGLPTLPAVAAALKCSPRALERRLKAQGLGFRTLMADTLRDEAIRLLGNPALSVARAGELLGYSECSAFTRAFKAWTGLGPSAWREQAESRQSSIDANLTN
ncbi:AraC family transcriptional regulator [Aquabacterium lacunae]|uniref:AraC family transcriptional regulator n=1 Tax=Aquabacterium lacunae TaxID=2528630 RepID=A0A4Q9GYQ3_9BURK|nr:AraC family transcriptional regulator [Aquabacterium lacunae]TBO31164.1 AraC family transcriptional regulator [Aquabacterium lacunae]